MFYFHLFRNGVFSIFFCTILNFTYFYIIEDKFNILKLFKKSVAYNYLSIEPYLVRLKKVDFFEYMCEGIKCLPLSTIDYTRVKFIKKIQNKLEQNELIFVPLSLSDYIFLDLRFYLNNPIFLDTRSLGVAYYAEKDYFIKYRKRFYLAYAFEYCENSYNHNDQKRENYINEILKILNLDKKQVCIISNKLDSEFKKNKIKYLIDIKEPKINYSEKICEGKYCLYKIK